MKLCNEGGHVTIVYDDTIGGCPECASEATISELMDQIIDLEKELVNCEQRLGLGI